MSHIPVWPPRPRRSMGPCRSKQEEVCRCRRRSNHCLHLLPWKHQHYACANMAVSRFPVLVFDLYSIQLNFVFFVVVSLWINSRWGWLVEDWCVEVCWKIKDTFKWFSLLSPVKTRGYRVELVRLSVRLSVRPSVCLSRLMWGTLCTRVECKGAELELSNFLHV